MGHNLAIATQADFYVVHCGDCGGVYAILERVRKQKHQEGACWTCPYCKCRWGYSGQGLNAELKRELQQERKYKEWAQQDARNARANAEHIDRRRRGEMAAKTRIKNRIANGVCPCCNRSFKDLHRHMMSKHPDYATGTK